MGADPRHARIIAQFLTLRPFGSRGGIRLEELAKQLGRVTEHGSELETVERLAVKSDALVAEENRLP